MNTFVRKDKTYKLPNLPEIKGRIFTYNNQIGYTGSVFSRPVIGAGGVLYSHFAVFYGFDKAGKAYLLENNTNGVECISFEDYLSDSKEWKVSYYEKDPNKTLTVFIRAFSRMHYPYDEAINNCEHFANYLSIGKLISKQVMWSAVGISIVVGAINEYYMKDPEKYQKEIDDMNIIKPHLMELIKKNS